MRGCWEIERSRVGCDMKLDPAEQMKEKIHLKHFDMFGN